jgi:hypothetical protein
MKRLLLLLICTSLVYFTNAQISLRADVPGFLRTGDHIEIPVHIFNHIDKEVTGQIQFLLINKQTKISVDGWMQNVFPVQHYSVSGKTTQTLSFPMTVPMEVNFSTLSFLVVAGKDTVAVGESNIEVAPTINIAGLRLSHTVHLFRNGEEVSLNAGDNISVNDTVVMKIRLVTDKKYHPTTVDIQPAANLLTIGDAQKIKKMNVMIVMQRCIVTHKGSCATIISGRSNGSSGTAFSSFTIPVD